MFRTLAECFVSSLEVYVRSLLLKNLMSNLLLKHVLASHSWILILLFNIKIHINFNITFFLATP